MNTNSIKLHRLKNLARYEWAIAGRFYQQGILGVFIFIVGVFLTIWFNKIEGFIWSTADYNYVFFGGFIFLSVFGISQSFIDLREENTSIRYLTLPVSAIEKYLVQVCFRLVLPLILYPILFWLGANLSVDAYYFIQHSLLNRTLLPVIEKAEILHLYWIPTSDMELVYWALFASIALIPTLMFLGGILFGKWNFIVMPAAVSIILALFLGSYFGLSWLLNASAFGSGGNYAIRFDYPEVMDGVPLLIFVSTILVWLGLFLTFLLPYLKLKEREV